MSLDPSQSLPRTIIDALGSLDLTLESELALFRRHLQLDELQAADAERQAAAEIMTDSDAPEQFTLHQDASLEQNLSLAEDWEEVVPEIHSAERHDLEANSVIKDEDPARGGALVVPSRELASNQVLDEGVAETYADPELDDYLESSEALLEHLDAPIPKHSLEESSAIKWFGWAAGITLVLSLLAAFFLPTFFPKRSPSKTQPLSSENAAQQSPADNSETQDPNTSDIPGPNLAEKEFVDVNSSTLPRLTPSPTVNPPVATVTPSSPSTPATTTDGRQYYVVTDYPSDAELKKIQGIAPSAKVVEFTGGEKIQLGQYSSLEQAQNAADEWRQKGLEITILATDVE